MGKLQGWEASRRQAAQHPVTWSTDLSGAGRVVAQARFGRGYVQGGEGDGRWLGGWVSSGARRGRGASAISLQPPALCKVALLCCWLLSQLTYLLAFAWCM